MEKVSTLRELNLRGSRYLFILSQERRHGGDLQETLDKKFDKFGDIGGLPVRAVRATKIGRNRVQRELEKKAWPSAIKARLKSDADPILVVIEADFSGFDPTKDDWRIIWLGDARQPSNSIPNLLDAFQTSVERNQGPFAYLDSLPSAGTGMAPFGRVSGPKSLGTDRRGRREGRPSILDPEYGLRESVHQILRSDVGGEIRNGSKLSFAERVYKANPMIERTFASSRSVYNAMRRAGLLKNIGRK